MTGRKLWDKQHQCYQNTWYEGTRVSEPLRKETIFDLQIYQTLIRMLGDLRKLKHNNKDVYKNPPVPQQPNTTHFGAENTPKFSRTTKPVFRYLWNPMFFNIKITKKLNRPITGWIKLSHHLHNIHNPPVPQETSGRAPLLSQRSADNISN